MAPRGYIYVGRDIKRPVFEGPGFSWTPRKADIHAHTIIARWSISSHEPDAIAAVLEMSLSTSRKASSVSVVCRLITHFRQ